MVEKDTREITEMDKRWVKIVYPLYVTDEGKRCSRLCCWYDEEHPCGTYCSLLGAFLVGSHRLKNAFRCGMCKKAEVEEPVFGVTVWGNRRK